jgi:phage terminase small subunit
MTKVTLEPPQHLSARAKGLWRCIVPCRAKSAGRLVMLTAALEQLDRADTMRALLDGQSWLRDAPDGRVLINPMVRAEGVARRDFVRTWRLLGLDRDQARRLR